MRSLLMQQPSCDHEVKQCEDDSLQVKVGKTEEPVYLLISLNCDVTSEPQTHYHPKYIFKPLQ